MEDHSSHGQHYILALQAETQSRPLRHKRVLASYHNNDFYVNKHRFRCSLIRQPFQASAIGDWDQFSVLCFLTGILPALLAGFNRISLPV